jgi:hypothetical protein
MIANPFAEGLAIAEDPFQGRSTLLEAHNAGFGSDSHGGVLENLSEPLSPVREQAPSRADLWSWERPSGATGISCVCVGFGFGWWLWWCALGTLPLFCLGRETNLLIVTKKHFYSRGLSGDD